MKEELKKELEEIEKRLKGDFINPKDVRRKDEIISLLLTNGESSNIRFKITMLPINGSESKT